MVLAGVAAHTTCGSDALATTRRSGCVSAACAPQVADRVHLAVAVELVAAEVAEHEQLRVERVDHPGQDPLVDLEHRQARRPRLGEDRARCPT